MSRRLSPAPVGPAGTPLSSTESLARAFQGLDSRLRMLETGSDRGPGSSYGAPFHLVAQGGGTFTFFVDSSGQLCVRSPSGAITVIAPP